MPFRYKMRRVMRGAMRSKMVWLGLSVSILGVIYENFEYVRNIIDPKYFGIIFIFLGVVVNVLRFYTTLPLDKK